MQNILSLSDQYWTIVALSRNGYVLTCEKDLVSGISIKIDVQNNFAVRIDLAKSNQSA